ncbi:MAG: hypothetical protein AABX51_08610 [Nanoarchaeota archaeon]
MNEKKWSLVLIAIGMMMIVITMKYAKAEPNGANLSVLNSSRMNLSNMGAAVQAQAGNVTELNIVGTSITKYWQGYFGNITGTIMLGDANGKNLYQWALASPRGEIYAARNGSGISWANVGCANSSQVENEDNFIGANPAETIDSVNKTFSYTTHPSFAIAGRGINGCRSVSVNGTGNGDLFWEALLIDNGSQVAMYDDILIYTGLIDADTVGFTGSSYDFQMIVGENGNGSEEFPNGNPTNYYFYVEIE